MNVAFDNLVLSTKELTVRRTKGEKSHSLPGHSSLGKRMGRD